MSKRLSTDVSGKISDVMFQNFSDTESESFLKNELERYVPQFTGWQDKDITDFINYQQSIWLHNKQPKLGTPIACLNPTFVDSVDAVQVTSKDLEVYTRASEKENGYRFQLHNSSQKKCAFTRQFTSYDLRMLPELSAVIDALPVMIGDAELINKEHIHLAGFNRVNRRIPDMRYWPRKGEDTIDDTVLKNYLADEKMFEKKMPIAEYQLTLAFHGMFAIADPNTWDLDKKIQEANMISLCSLPMDYEKVDDILDQLKVYITKKGIDAKVVERKVIRSKSELASLVKKNEDAGLEGTVVVQYAKNKEGTPSFKFGKSIKIKKYETIDTVLLGVYLANKSVGLEEQNMTGALLGLYDDKLGTYLPVCKVNLDPSGVQIKTIGQKERLTELRKELVRELEGKEDAKGKVATIYETYLNHGQIKLERALTQSSNISSPEIIGQMFDTLPRGCDIQTLMADYTANRESYDAGLLGVKKSSSKKEQWIASYQEVLSGILDLKKTNTNCFRDVMKYLGKSSELKAVSKKLLQPNYVVNTDSPVILETQVFQVEWGMNQFAAGFHTWYGDSFRFNNCFAERVRHDKSSTTDYSTIYQLARKNTVRK